MSKIDLAKVNAQIDEQIRQLETFKRDFGKFLDNPATATLLEKFVTAAISNGNGDVQEGVRLAKNRQKIGNYKGHLLSAVAQACGEIAPEVEFTVHDVMARMVTNGYVFHAKNSQVSVNSSLARLMRKHKIIRIQEAQGQRPAKYKLVQQ